MDKNKKILDELSRLYPDAKPALLYSTPFELLVAVILSAQCTDERVNKVTRELFKEYSTPQAVDGMDVGLLEKYIYSCGFYRAKAAHIKSAAHDIIQKFGGEVPSSHADLKTLAGVGQKTANVVYAVAFGGDAIAVDTHVFRVSKRLGLASGNTPEKVEEDLKKVIPKSDWSKAHHWLIYHGRRVCHSRKPDCAACTLKELCDYRNSVK